MKRWRESGRHRFCAYCGHRCHGRTCQYCKDLPRLEAVPDQYAAPTMREELLATKGKER